VTSALHYMEIHELARRIHTRDISPVEVVEHQFDRIRALDPALHAFSVMMEERAMQDAKDAEVSIARGEYRGPLHGVPLALKDIFDIQHYATMAGMPLRKATIAAQNATVMDRLTAAGAVIVGKCQMTEGAFAIHHPDIEEPLNPWHAGVWPGASSSGSGIATSAGLCFGSLGTDTGGSVRFPCAATGLTGLKPTWGRVSRFGCFPFAETLDHIGPLARCAQDTLLLFNTIKGRDDRDSTSFSVGLENPQHLPLMILNGLRVGVDEHWINEGVDDDIRVSVGQLIDLLRQHGAEIVPVSVPETYDVSSQWERHAGIQAALYHSEMYEAHTQQYGPALARLIETGRSLTAMDYQRILLAARRFTGEMGVLLGSIDCLLAPVQPYAAPTFERLADLANDPEANRRLIQFTSPFNVSGHPSLSLPVETTKSGLPLGAQIIGQKCSDERLCQIGIAIQSCSNWHRKHPLA